MEMGEDSLSGSVRRADRGSASAYGVASPERSVSTGGALRAEEERRRRVPLLPRSRDLPATMMGRTPSATRLRAASAICAAIGAADMEGRLRFPKSARSRRARQTTRRSLGGSNRAMGSRFASSAGPRSPKRSPSSAERVLRCSVTVVGAISSAVRFSSNGNTRELRYPSCRGRRSSSRAWAL